MTVLNWPSWRSDTNPSVSPGATAAMTAAGIALIALAGRDVFDALFHPEGRSTLARAMMRGVWGVLGRPGRGSRSFVVAGPVGLLLVFAGWACLLVVGWTLIFLPHMPDGFHRATGGPADSDLVEALNVSLVTLTTLGFGDVTPDTAWLRVIVPIEALLGFGLLSASISWLLLIHPALARRRSLAYEVGLLRKAEEETGTPLVGLDSESLEQIYAELSSRLVAIERDLVNFPVTYYFAEDNERFSLAVAMPYLVELAEHGADPSVPAGLRIRAAVLRDAVDDFAATISTRFHGARSEATAEVLKAYARDHG
jgi:Ion channel